MARIAGATLAILITAGCSSSSPPARSAAPPTMPSEVAAEPPLLDLCRLPNLAPADLRSQPGYLEFAVSVIDANGAPVSGLKQADFAVSDSARTYPIAFFRETSTKTPVSMVIVGDTSSTLYNKTVVRSGNLTAIRRKLDQAAQDVNECNEAAVVLGGGDYAPGFDPAAFGLPTSLSDVNLLQPFTTDFGNGLTKMENVLPSGRDRLPDEIKMAMGQLDNAHYPRRALVIMTDGLDANAVDQSAPLLEQARAKGIAIWVIGSGEPDAATGTFSALTGTSRVDVAAVKRLAAAGGAEALFSQPLDKDGGASLATAVSTIGKQLGQGYAIAVLASSPDAKPTVALAKPGNATIRAAVVPSQVLADAAARHPPPIQPGCVATSPSAPPPAISSKPGYTQVRITVWDADGNPVRGLKESDFTASADTDSLPIVYFHERTQGPPRSVIIAIDTSGSMQPKIEPVRRAVGKLIKGLNPCDEVALIAFSARPFLLQPLTSDHRLVEQRLGLLHSYGATALYDAIDISIKNLSKGKYPDRMVVLITDGMDNVSGTSREQVLAAAATKHIPIYPIGIGKPTDHPRSLLFAPLYVTGPSLPESEVDKPTLEALATQSGATVSIVPSMSEDGGQGFARAVAALHETLEKGYEVGFIAPRAGISPALAVTNHSDYVVRIVEPRPASSAAVTAASH